MARGIRLVRASSEGTGEAGGETDAAKACYRAAAQEARRRISLEESEVCYRRWLALEPADIDARLELAEVVLLRGGADAETLVIDALALASDRGDRELIATVRRQIGVTQHAVGKTDQGLESLREALKLCGRRGSAVRARTLASMGQVRLDQGEVAEAIDCLQKAQRMAEGQPELRIDTLGTLAVALWGVGRMRRATRLLEEAVALARRCQDPHREARTLANLANLYQNRGDVTRAAELYSRSIRTMNRLGDIRAVAILEGNLAVCQKDLGRFTKARQGLHRALRLAQRLGDRRYAGRVHLNLGVVSHNLGRRDAAAEHYATARDLAVETADRAIEATALGNLAELRGELGEVSEAREMLMRALEIHRQLGARRYEGHVLHGLGELHRLEGSLDQAESHFREALQTGPRERGPPVRGPGPGTPGYDRAFVPWAGLRVALGGRCPAR